MTVNHKKVKRLMKVMGLFGKVIRTGNEINRYFSADQPRKKILLTSLSPDLITAKKYIYHQF